MSDDKLVDLAKQRADQAACDYLEALYDREVLKYKMSKLLKEIQVLNDLLEYEGQERIEVKQ